MRARARVPSLFLLHFLLYSCRSSKVIANVGKVSRKSVDHLFLYVHSTRLLRHEFFKRGEREGGGVSSRPVLKSRGRFRKCRNLKNRRCMYILSFVARIEMSAGRKDLERALEYPIIRYGRFKCSKSTDVQALRSRRFLTPLIENP